MNKFIDYFIVIWRELVYNMCMLNKKMNKKYKLEEIGGMNGEVLLRERLFDNMDEVMSYFKDNDIRDDNEELVEKLYDEGWIEFEGVRDYVVNEGLVLIEL